MLTTCLGDYEEADLELIEKHGPGRGTGYWSGGGGAGHNRFVAARCSGNPVTIVEPNEVIAWNQSARTSQLTGKRNATDYGGGVFGDAYAGR